MRRLPRRKRRPTLMLTSLLDMFTIILIFLIVSFDAEDYDFRLEKGLALPQSEARSAFKPAVNVAVTRDGVYIEQTLVAPLTDGEAPEAWHSEAAIPPVVAAFEQVIARAQQAEAAAGVEAPAERIMMLQADKSLAYRTLYLVLRSARLAGMDKYRLAVMRR